VLPIKNLESTVGQSPPSPKPNCFDYLQQLLQIDLHLQNEDPRSTIPTPADAASVAAFCSDTPPVAHPWASTSPTTASLPGSPSASSRCSTHLAPLLPTSPHCSTLVRSRPATPGRSRPARWDPLADRSPHGGIRRGSGRHPRAPSPAPRQWPHVRPGDGGARKGAGRRSSTTSPSLKAGEDGSSPAGAQLLLPIFPQGAEQERRWR
jgi:hypothetical protein